MRKLAALAAVPVLFLGITANTLATTKKPSRFHPSSHVRAAQTSFQRATARLARAAAFRSPAGETAHKALLSVLEADIVGRINAQRSARGLRPLSVSRGLTAAADYHSHQMGRFGFFEHESQNGAPFWRRIERFYPSGRNYWSVGENIFWESPDTSASSTVREWMHSSPHRQNILTREWREVGVAAVHFSDAGGAFRGRSVTIVTADFGVRR